MHGHVHVGNADDALSRAAPKEGQSDQPTDRSSCKHVYKDPNHPWMQTRLPFLVEAVRCQISAVRTFGRALRHGPVVTICMEQSRGVSVFLI
jgi:hypothetical protein